MDKEIVCTLKEIEKSYGPEHALGPVSLFLERGTVTGIYGPNGCGKSTLLSIITGILKPSAGKRETAGGRICYVPQELALYPSLSGRDNLRFWAGIYGLRGKNAAEQVRAVLETVELTEKAASPVETYSGGMKRRLNIAAALLTPAELLVMDEPSAGCDVHSMDIILRVIRRCAENHCAVVLVDHSMEELEQVCDRILFMEKGRILSERQL